MAALTDDMDRVAEAAGRCLCTITDIAARWHRSYEHEDRAEFHVGRRVEIEHVLASLMGVSVTEIRRTLRAGQL
jgi:hypothetical protein